MVERAIEITAQDFRSRQALGTCERQAALVARGASRIMNSRHLTGHAVDLVALEGEVSRQWEDYLRVAAAMRAAAHELEVPACWGGCWDSLLAIASPGDSVADCVAACRATGQKPFLDRPQFELSRACRHDRLDQDRAGHRRDRYRHLRDRSPLGGTSAWRASCSPPRRRFTPGSRRSSSSTATPGFLAPDQAWWRAHPLGMLCPEMDAAFVTSDGDPPATARRPVIIISAG